jgi:hypothetical protein
LFLEFDTYKCTLFSPIAHIHKQLSSFRHSGYFIRLSLLMCFYCFHIFYPDFTFYGWIFKFDSAFNFIVCMLALVYCFPQTVIKFQTFRLFHSVIPHKFYLDFFFIFRAGNYNSLFRVEKKQTIIT